MRSSRDRIKVLHFCETAMGGVGTYQKGLAEMDASAFDQVFLMPAKHAAIMGDESRVITYPLKKRGAMAIFAQIRAFRNLARTQRPDVAFFHSSFSLPVLLAMRVLGGLPRTIYCAHGWAALQYGESFRARVVRAIEGRLCGLADVVVNVSIHDLEVATTGNYGGRQILIENAVPPPAADVRSDLFAGEPDKLHLLFVGRFDRQKGLDILFAALRRIREKRPDIVLHVIGAAVREADQPEVPDGVDMVGWVDRRDIDSWYASADALVVPSRWEGLPLVIPEALRNGTPVITSRRCGMEQLFEEGKSGIAFEANDEALAKTLMSLNKHSLREMRANCSALYGARYSMDRLFREVAEVYAE